MENSLKKCGKCKLEKSENDFSPANFKKPNAWCRACGSEYNRKKKEDRLAKLDPNQIDKICRVCKITKLKNEFHEMEFIKENPKCIICVIEYNKKNHEENKEERNEYSKNYYAEHKEENRERGKRYRAEHADEIREDKKQYREEHKEEIAEKKKQHRQDNIEQYKEKDKIYYEDNRDRILEQKHEYYLDNIDAKHEYNQVYYEEHYEEKLKYNAEYIKQRKQIDPAFAFMLSISSSIYKFLKENDGSKDGQSSRPYIEFTPEQLVQHIENQFSLPENLTPDGKVWMNFQNRGKYIKSEWDDNDPSTWKWQLDHIKPQSDYPFDSLDHPNFKIVWALSNLRPLSAKQNIKDGASKIRHIKKVK